jgi:hypothetical protein
MPSGKINPKILDLVQKGLYADETLAQPWDFHHIEDVVRDALPLKVTASTKSSVVGCRHRLSI